VRARLELADPDFAPCWEHPLPAEAATAVLGPDWHMAARPAGSTARLRPPRAASRLRASARADLGADFEAASRLAARFVWASQRSSWPKMSMPVCRARAWLRIPPVMSGWEAAHAEAAARVAKKFMYPQHRIQPRRVRRPGHGGGLLDRLAELPG
jgi:hypothetical protein